MDKKTKLFKEITGAIPKVMPKEKYTIPKEFHDRKIAERIRRIEEEENKKKKIFEKIISRFAEAVYYKIKRDIALYGECRLEIGNTDDLNDIIDIRKMLDGVKI